MNQVTTINHPEPLLECEVKWALRSIVANKSSGCDEIPVKLFKSLKDASIIKVLHSLCQQICKTQQWPQDWKRSILIPNPMKGSTKEHANHWTVALISHSSKVMFRLQHYGNHELPDAQGGFRKGRRTRHQIAKICWLIEKAREFQKNIYICVIEYAKAFDYIS